MDLDIMIYSIKRFSSDAVQQAALEDNKPIPTNPSAASKFNTAMDRMVSSISGGKSLIDE